MGHPRAEDNTYMYFCPDSRIYRNNERRWSSRIIERSFYRLDDWRPIAIGYDKPAATFASAGYLAAIVIW